MLSRGVLVAVMGLVIACSGSGRKGYASEKPEEYPDFSEAVAQLAPPGNVAIPKLRNTATFRTVEIKQMKFLPDILTIHRGDTVRWINNDITDHDITETPRKAWSSSKLSHGQAWQKVIMESTDYFCSIHVVMKGKIIVE